VFPSIVSAGNMCPILDGSSPSSIAYFTILLSQTF
jgi:hypothetical protein